VVPGFVQAHPEGGGILGCIICEGAILDRRLVVVSAIGDASGFYRENRLADRLFGGNLEDKQLF